MGIEEAMRRRYKAPEWGLLFEVANGTGGRKQRSADALAMSLWPSRGLHLHGFEFKKHRDDWTRELRNPGKSEPVQKFCHFWWIVAPKGMVKLDELPPTWGLLELHGEKTLRMALQAPELSPTAVDYSFMASVFRRVDADHRELVFRSELSELVGDARLQGRAAAEADAKHAASTAERDLAALRNVVAAFEEHAGIKIPRGRYTADIAARVGDRYKLVCDLEELTRKVEHITSLKPQLDELRSGLHQFKLASEEVIGGGK